MYYAYERCFRNFKKSEFVLISKEGKEDKEIQYQIEHKNGINVDDFFLPTRHGTTYGALREIEIDKPELEECYKLVCNLYPQVFHAIGFENDKIRDGIMVAGLCDYVQECIFMLSSTIARMHKTWSYRKPRPKTGETKWYSFLFGKSRTTKFFQEAEDQRKDWKKLDKRSVFEKKRIQEILFYDDDVQYHLKEIDSKKYEDIVKKYSVFCKLVKDIAYPKFLDFLIKNKKI